MLKAITRAANSVSFFADFICFKKINKCLAKSLATGFCFFKALIKLNKPLEV
jgi:hypothetical protein